ncbi:MAG TPA: ATP-binding protein [Phycisphaerae bacterium]|nr:ATP-binding protein [Phycisphaerae bacterium]HRY67616.1 ATP-binding protein [Phycisphaerae bacterium]HSA25003.1 ATP-binding protein [Phycisphaerae bacterium]
MNPKGRAARTQPQVIDVDKDKCVNCHACISACPVKFCNDGSGSYVKVDPDTCIGCGHCLRACLHQARRFVDDLGAFTTDLDSGLPMVAIVAPSAAANYPDTYMNLVGWLKKRGVKAVFDVSFGAELAAHALVEFIRTRDPRLVIASPCPAIVTYIQTYQPELLPHLAPVDSPMVCTMKMIRAHYPQYADCRIAAISPCVAKKREFAEAGLGDYNVAFESLNHLFRQENIDLSQEPLGTFENPPAELAVLFSTPGGLLRTAQRWMPELAQRTRRIEGIPIVYDYLRHLPEVLDHDRAPLLVDCLSCAFGCNAGPATHMASKSPDDIEYWIEKRCQEATACCEQQPLLAGQPGRPNINTLVSAYRPEGIASRQYADLRNRNRTQIPDERTRWVILGQMHKYAETDLYNCTSCGYLSCTGMATAIYNGKNKPDNCHFYLAREREITHREMVEREKRFRTILTTCIEGFVSVDNDFVITEVNPAFCRMLAMGPDRIVGRSLQDLTDDAGRDQLNRQIQLRQAGNSSAYEIRLVRGDAKTVDCLFSASPIRDSTGRKTGSFAMVTDITARKQAEADLHKAHDELEQRVRDRTSELARANSDLQVEIAERERAEAARRLNEVRLVAMLRLHGMKERSIQEITDFAVENATVMTESEIGYLAFLNEDESVLTMCSWSKNAMAECTIIDKPVAYPVHATGLWGEAVRQRKAIITNDYPAPNPYKKGTPPGHVKIVRHMNIPVFDGDKIVAVVGVGNKSTDYDETDARQLTLFANGMWDLIRRKRADEALHAAKEAAEAATRAKSEFLAVMSHEIRTPMSGVIGMLDILLRSPHPPQEQNYLEMASDSAKSLLVLLEDILDTSRIEAGKLKLEAIPFRPRQVLTEAIETFRIRAESKGLHLTCDSSPGVPQVLIGDPTRLRQILVNLVGNAVKFTQHGGIRIAARCDSRAENKAVIRVTVRDSGIGIPLEAQPHLFQKFQQADTSTTRQYGGAGLGLSICRSLVTMMDGTISVESEPGRGSAFTFTVRLPLGDDKDAERSGLLQESAARRPYHAARLKLLGAEDNPVNQTIARVLVEGMGHQIDFVDNGQQAVEALSAQPYDAVLMDARMPVLDGLRATGIIRDPESPALDHEIYIIAMTANASAADREQCLAAGMNEYVRKPVDEACLYAALANAIEHQRNRGMILDAMPGSASTPAPSPRSEQERPSSPSGVSAGIAFCQKQNDAPSEFADVAGQFSPEALHEITAQYLQDTPDRIAEMKAAFKNRDTETLSRAAHTLKSSSRYVRAAGVSRLGAEIEQRADRGEWAEMEQWIARLEVDFQKVKSCLLASGDPSEAGEAKP